MKKLLILFYLAFVFSPVGALIDLCWWHAIGKKRFREQFGFDAP